MPAGVLHAVALLSMSFNTQAGLAARATVVDRSNGADVAAQPVPIAEANAQARQVRTVLPHDSLQCPTHFMLQLK